MTDKVDLKEVAKLLQALEADLAKLQSGQGDYAALREEIEALKAALHVTDHGEVRDRLKGVHGFLNEAEDTAFTGARYIGEIGRILGM
jgi:hypothetical protein